MTDKELLKWFEKLEQRVLELRTSKTGEHDVWASVFTEMLTALTIVFPASHVIISRWETAVARGIKAMVGNRPAPPEMFVRDELIGIFQTARSLIANGFTRRFADGIRAETVAVCLDQSESFARSGYSVAAMILAGGALETHLRGLCIRFGLTWQGNGSIGSYKQTLDQARNSGIQSIVSSSDSSQIESWGAVDYQKLDADAGHYVINEGKDVKDTLYAGDKYQISYYQSATVLALQRNLKERKTEKPLFALGNPIYTKEDPRYLAWKEREKENSTSPISPPYKGGENISSTPPNLPLQKGGVTGTEDLQGGEKETVVVNLDKYSFRGIAIKAKWGKTTEADTTGKDIEFPPLPETEIEVKEIAKTMGIADKPPDVLLSVMANETEMRKTGLERYKYIHFATHASLPGMIQGINEPFILLGQVENKDKDDGFLTLSEVLDLRLNADMVVLSACVTGVGKEVEGEGVANFARAFQHAGVKSVVVSLWEVASDPAVEYMEKFYEYLKAGKSRSEAMRLARNEIKAKYPNPFYWAVFILHGEG